MTIAAGFKCTDGITLGADTEYTWDTVLKLPGPKIYTHREPSFSLAFAGAGDVDFIRMTVERILYPLKGQSPSLQQIEVVVRTIIKIIHDEHLYPFPGTTYERPTVELLIGVWTKESGLELLKTRLTSVTRVENYECIGVGMYLGRYIAESFYHPSISNFQARFLCIQMIERVKGYVPGCGGETQCVTMNTDGTMILNSKDVIRVSEHYLSRIIDTVNTTVFELLNPNIDKLEPNKFGEQLGLIVKTSLESLLNELTSPQKLSEYNPEELKQKVREKIKEILDPDLKAKQPASKNSDQAESAESQ